MKIHEEIKPREIEWQGDMLATTPAFRSELDDFLEQTRGRLHSLSQLLRQCEIDSEPSETIGENHESDNAWDAVTIPDAPSPATSATASPEQVRPNSPAAPAVAVEQPAPVQSKAPAQSQAPAQGRAPAKPPVANRPPANRQPVAVANRQASAAPTRPAPASPPQSTAPVAPASGDPMDRLKAIKLRLAKQIENA